MSTEIIALSRVIAEQQAQIDELEARLTPIEKAQEIITEVIEVVGNPSHDGVVLHIKQMIDRLESLKVKPVEQELDQDESASPFYIFDPEAIGERRTCGTFRQVKDRSCRFKIGDTEVPCESVEFNRNCPSNIFEVTIKFKVLPYP